MTRYFVLSDGSCGGYDGPDDAWYAAHVPAGAIETSAPKPDQVWDKNAGAWVTPTTSWRVPKIVISQRLAAAGFAKVAYDTLYNPADDAAAVLAIRWDDARDGILSTDAAARAFLTAIGADPDAILAPGNV